MQNIRAQSPYELGLCTKPEIEDAVEKYQPKKETQQTDNYFKSTILSLM